MSVINQMLKDLQARQAKPQDGGQAPYVMTPSTQVAPSAVQTGRPVWFWVVPLCVLTTLLGVLVSYGYQRGFQQGAQQTSTQVPPPGAEAVVVASTSAPAQAIAANSIAPAGAVNPADSRAERETSNDHSAMNEAVRQVAVASTSVEASALPPREIETEPQGPQTEKLKTEKQKEAQTAAQSNAATALVQERDQTIKAIDAINATPVQFTAEPVEKAERAVSAPVQDGLLSVSPPVSSSQASSAQVSSVPIASAPIASTQIVVAQTDSAQSASTESTSPEMGPSETAASEQEAPVSLSAQEAPLAITQVQLSVDELAALEYKQAKTALQEGELAQAKAHLQRTLHYQPKHNEGRQQLAALLFGEGNSQAAIQLLNTGLSRSPDYAHFRLMLARIYLKGGDEKQAFYYLNPLRPDVRTHLDYYATLAALAQKMAQYPVARESYLALTKHDPHRARWWLGLAITEEQLGAQENALIAYQTAQAMGQLSAASRRYIEGRLLALTGESSTLTD